MSIDEIETIAILVQFKNGNAHQVLASKENKALMLQLLAQSENGLRVTTEIEPVTFKFKK